MSEPDPDGDGDANCNVDTDVNPDRHSDGNRHGSSDGHSDGNVNPDGNRNIDTDRYRHSDCNFNGNGNGNGSSDCYGNRNRNRDGHSGAYRYGDRDGNGDTYSCAYGDSYGHSGADCHCNGDCNGNRNCNANSYGDSDSNAAAAQPVNLSTRLQVQTGDGLMIGGFIITGNAPKKVLMRALGPSLANFGITNFVPDPLLQLRAQGGALIQQNDNWKDSQQAEIQATGLAPSDDREAVIIATLAPGQYTGLLTNKLGAPGIGTFELYDLNFSANSELANIATRGIVLNGNNVMIAGFVIGNSANPTNLAIRARGPSLSNFFGNVLADPTLELRDSNGALIIANDDWQDDPVSAALLTANGLGLSDPKESGLFLALIAPGQYTAIVAGKNGGTGIALVELYNVK